MLAASALRGPEPQPLSHTPKYSPKHMPNWICNLTRVQAREYEFRGTLPDCANVNPYSDKRGQHQHIKASEAEGLVCLDDGTGEARWVGGKRMIAMNMKLGVLPRHGVMACVDFMPPSKSPGSYPVEMSGAHERRMSAQQVNAELVQA